jgi:hypothetical protein
MNTKTNQTNQMQKQFGATKEIEHRMAMIQDDVSMCIECINTLFANQQQANDIDAYTQLLTSLRNINIASNLNDIECLDWGFFFKK